MKVYRNEVANMAARNVRAMTDEAVAEWLRHPMREVRAIARLEVKRRRRAA